MPDVEITAGVNSSAVKTGLAEIRNYATETFSGIKSQLTGLFAAGAIEEGIRGIVEYGAHVQDLSNRFGVSTTAIQQFGHAAELNGSSLDAVAQGFGKLEVAQAKALGGNQDIIKAFSGLGVSVDDLRNLSPEQIMLKIGSSSLNAADLVAVLGRSALQLRTTLAGLADGTQQLGDAMDANLIQKLKTADDTFKVFGQTAEVRGAQILDILTKIGKVAKYVFPFGLAVDKAAGSPLETTKPAARTFPTPDDSEATSGGGGGSTIEADDATRAQIAAEQEKAYMASLDNAHKLQEIDEQRNDLQDQLNTLMSQGGGEDGEDLKIKLQLAQLDDQSATIQQQIAKDKEVQAEKDQQALDTANKKLIASENETDVQNLLSQGKADEAELLKTSLDFDERIREAEQAAADARATGNDDLANTNTALAEQLKLQKDITIESEKQEQASKETLDDYYARAKAAGYTTGNTDSLSAGHTGIDLSQFPKSQASAAAGFFITSDAVTLATNPQTGQITDEDLANAILQISKETNNGQNNLGFRQQAGIDQRAQLLAAIQAQQGSANALAAANAAGQLRSNIFSDASHGGLDNSPILQQILQQLQQTHVKITPPPG